MNNYITFVFLFLASCLFSTIRADGCCSRNHFDCDAVWCGDTEEKCLSCTSGGNAQVWLPFGQLSQCKRLDQDCTNDIKGCCREGIGMSTLVCTGNQWHKQCKVAIYNTEAPTTSPTEIPTTIPSMRPSADCSSITDKNQCNQTYGCSYMRDTENEECRTAWTTDECSAFDGKALKCKKYGCIWKKESKNCEGRWDQICNHITDLKLEKIRV